MGWRWLSWPGCSGSWTSVASNRTTGMWLSSTPTCRMSLCNAGSHCQDTRLGLPCSINTDFNCSPFSLLEHRREI
ncbi:hypothetical protein QBC41DRAFT_531 [Cercophora samala]|uniref:Uncharacterized protein n=1 Tax=Cercophora samala TaxID=330535 RepID=A0AA39ZNF9_9PEZI|nr:hypothetical protein QBC41DRAFT_531 [Cercophora samala]